MKDTKENIAFFLPLLFCVCFVAVRFFLKCYDGAVYEADLKGIVTSISVFPFGIVKEQFLNGFLFSIYHYLIHILSYFKFTDGVLIYRIFNTIISLLCAGVVFKISTGIKNVWLGIFLLFYLALNHYFIYFSNRITPFCLSCLLFLILMFNFLDFLDFKNGFKNEKLKKLLIVCAIYSLCDKLAMLFVLSLFFGLYLIFKDKKRILNKFLKELKKYAYFYLVLFAILIAQLAYLNSRLIGDSLNNVAININSLYLFINEFFSPYLSFNSQEGIKQSTMGLLYTYFINPDIKNINSFKILITLFYSSFLPIAVFFVFSIKAVLKNAKLRLLFFVSGINLCLLFILFYFNYIEFSPEFAYQFFFVSIIIFSYGLFLIKDIYLKSILIFCLLLIQTVIPEINAYTIWINKSAPCINAFDKFKTDYQVSENDLIVMPYLGNGAKKYYKNLNFFDFDFEYLKQKGKNNFLSDLIGKDEPLNKKNIYFLAKDYLFSNAQNEFFAKYFIENCIKDDNLGSRVILVVDKLNQKLISRISINKFASNTEYNLALRQLDFNSNILAQNTSFVLYSALSSRTLYNLVSLLNENFYPKEIVQYKRVQNSYYRVFNSNPDIYGALLSKNGDYVFIIYTKRIM